MSSKNLEDKAVNIKGKKYVLVSDRIIYFNETYPNGTIETAILSDITADRVVVKAVVVPDVSNPDRFFVGHSQALWGEGYINKSAAIENCETSAVGRALAMLGIGVIDSIASVDEITKAQNTEKQINMTDKFTIWRNSIMKVESIEDLDAIEEKLSKVAIFTDDQKIALQGTIEQRKTEIRNWIPA